MFSTLKNFRMNSSDRRSRTTRPVSKRIGAVEPLEARMMLASDVLPGNPEEAQPLESDPSDTVELAPEASSTDTTETHAFHINSLHLKVNGRDVAVTNWQRLEMNVGDTLEVVGVDYKVHADGQLDGLVALEGYLRKPDSSDPFGQIDYSDGRFGAPESNGPIAAGHNYHSGLEGSWNVEAGWNRLLVTMMRYTADGGSVETTFSVTLQVGQPDFVLRPERPKKLRVGEEATILGGWGNAGQGQYYNYSEVDISHVSDMNNPVWVGVLVGTAGAGLMLDGEYVNPTENDAFAERWTPQEEGEYRAYFYADPEHSWAESSESNNREVVTFKVRQAKETNKSDESDRSRDKTSSKESRSDDDRNEKDDDRWSDRGDRLGLDDDRLDWLSDIAADYVHGASESDWLEWR